MARSTAVRDWLAPQPSGTAPLTDPRTRRLVGLEVLVVLTVTLGLSAVRSGLALLDAVLQPVPLNEQQVALNAPAAQIDLIDLALQLTRVLQLVGWGALGAYLLLRAGFAMRDVGLDRRRPGRDALGAAGLAALIGVPGLGLYLVARAIGVSVTIAPTTLDDTWWRVPVLSGLRGREQLGRGGGDGRLPDHAAAPTRLVGEPVAPRPGRAARLLPPVPGPRRIRRQHRHGAGVRPRLAAHQPAVDARRRATP